MAISKRDDSKNEKPTGKFFQKSEGNERAMLVNRIKNNVRVWVSASILLFPHLLASVASGEEIGSSAFLHKVFGNKEIYRQLNSAEVVHLAKKLAKENGIGFDEIEMKVSSREATGNNSGSYFEFDKMIEVKKMAEEDLLQQVSESSKGGKQCSYEIVVNDGYSVSKFIKHVECGVRFLSPRNFGGNGWAFLVCGDNKSMRQLINTGDIFWIRPYPSQSKLVDFPKEKGKRRWRIRIFRPYDPSFSSDLEKLGVEIRKLRKEIGSFQVIADESQILEIANWWWVASIFGGSNTINEQDATSSATADDSGP